MYFLGMCVHCYKKAKQIGEDLQDKERAAAEAAKEAEIAKRQVNIAVFYS